MSWWWTLFGSVTSGRQAWTTDCICVFISSFRYWGRFLVAIGFSIFPTSYSPSWRCSIWCSIFYNSYWAPFLRTFQLFFHEGKTSFQFQQKLSLGYEQKSGSLFSVWSSKAFVFSTAKCQVWTVLGFFSRRFWIELINQGKKGQLFPINVVKETIVGESLKKCLKFMVKPWIKFFWKIWWRLMFKEAYI